MIKSNKKEIGFNGDIAYEMYLTNLYFIFFFEPSDGVFLPNSKQQSFFKDYFI